MTAHTYFMMGNSNLNSVSTENQQTIFLELYPVEKIKKSMKIYFKGRNFREWKYSRNFWKKLSRISRIS